jgi:Ca2+-binding RTX toxin-like protein
MMCSSEVTTPTTVRRGTGSDKLFGDRALSTVDGDDSLYGGPGRDTLVGRRGRCVVWRGRQRLPPRRCRSGYAQVLVDLELHADALRRHGTTRSRASSAA